MPTAPEDILPAFDDLTKFICMDNHTDLLIKTALVHYQFDMIRPFEKSNGVVNRALIPMMLLSEQYQSAQYLCISEFLYRNKKEYYDKLGATQWGSGYSIGVKFFLQAVCYASEQAIKQMCRFTEIVANDTNKVGELAKLSKSVLPVYNYFKRYLISEIKPIAEETGASYNTNAKVVELLVDAGILVLENKQSRHKIFKYSRILDAMSI
jgi:Fic family protein